MSTLERASRVTREESTGGGIEIGQWYWVKEGDGDRWLGCVSHVGSNYVKLRGPRFGNRIVETRIHFDQFATCELEPSPDDYIERQIAVHQENVQALMGEIRDVTARLGVGQRAALSDGGETQALTQSVGSRPVHEYKQALITAKDETLPELFKRVKEEHEHLAGWMTAKLIPLKAQVGQLNPVVKAVESRIFNVELYAGLLEDIVQIAGGDPAGYDEPVTLMQRRHYMDEECLANYRTGGMSFDQLSQFDEWLAQPENRDRLLPFPRTIIAMQVRRRMKERDDVSLVEFISLMFSDVDNQDKLTFLYIRNGDRIYRVNTAIDFGPKLFPDLNASELSAGLYINKWSYGSIRDEDIITEHRYHAELQKWEETPEKDRWVLCFEPSRWEPFTPDSVFYDDYKAYIDDKLAEHNRIVLILQGLLDRSEVLHPHLPVHLWTHEGFTRAVRLVYDDSRALVAGEAPDFGAYRAKLNRSLTVGSVTVGQDDYWAEREADRENAKHRHSNRYWPYKRYRPHGDPGPGILARVTKLSKKGARFEWRRERRRYSWADDEASVACSITVPLDRILNVDAYQPGDFRRFFNDPRTRASYLQWAPYLLEAEEYKAGNRDLADQREKGNEIAKR